MKRIFSAINGHRTSKGRNWSKYAVKWGLHLQGNIAFYVYTFSELLLFLLIIIIIIIIIAAGVVVVIATT